MQHKRALTDETALRAQEITSHDVARSAGTTLLARLGAVVEVVAQPIYVWLFGLASYGIYTALWAAVILAENIADMGMTAALQRTVPQAKTEREAVAALRAAVLLGVGPTLAVAVVADIFAPQLAQFFNAADQDAAQLTHFIQVFAWTLPLWAFVEIGTSALRARQVFGAEIRLRLFWEQIVRLLAAAGLWAAGFGAMALFYAHILSLILICGLCIRLLARNYDLSLLASGPSHQRVWRESWLAGISVMPANLVARLFSDAPTLALNALLPGAAGAIAGAQFALARKLSSVVQMIRLAFAYVLSPMASAASRGGKAAVEPIYGFATRVSLVIALPVSLVMIAGGPTLLEAIGAGMQTAKFALTLLLLARLGEAVTGAAAPIQQVVSRYSSQYVGSALGLMLSLMLGLLLLPSGGLSAMALAVAAGLITTSSVPVWQLWRHEALQPFARPFASTAARALGVSMSGFGVGLALNLLPLALALPLLLTLLLATLWACCRWALPYADRGSLGAVSRRLRLI